MSDEEQKFWNTALDSPFYTKKYKFDPGLKSRATRALPDEIKKMIRENPGTSYPDPKHDTFSTSGDFRCPCCGRKVTMYEPSHGRDEYEINTWGHCPHFGFNGIFPSDAIGIYMANRFGQNTKRNALEAIRELDSLSFTTPSEEERRAKILADRYEERRTRSEANVSAVRDNTKWGDDIPPQGLRAMKARGLENLNLLSEGTKQMIGWCEGIKLKCLTRDDDYTASGLVFSLDGGRGFQIRRVGKNGRFVCVSKEKQENGTAKNKVTRFYTIGPAGPFNIDALDFSNGLDPIFVTEGPLDAVTMEMALRREDKGPDHVRVISIQGCENTSYLGDELRRRGGFFSVFLALDSDDPGVEAQMRLDGLLRENPNVTVLPFPGYMGFKDMNALWMADRKKAADYMKTIHSIGRHMMDGRISENAGMDLLLSMADMTLENFENRRKQTLDRFHKAIEERSAVPTVSEAQFRKTEEDLKAKTSQAIGGTRIER